ncbi:hypothetical protein [Streptomyces sp. NBC_00354]|uniref:hypothetical protein n=1 Tax=Streptomyces sp. NBC_00354 TaxID=2975723 RepID=UPI002E26F0F6|nr:hypothetical protein OG296_01400 [Streptomyces sp. NBC_01001]
MTVTVSMMSIELRLYVKGAKAWHCVPFVVVAARRPCLERAEQCCRTQPEPAGIADIRA